MLKLIPVHGVVGYRGYGQVGPIGWCRGAAWVIVVGMRALAGILHGLGGLSPYGGVNGC